MDCWESFLLHPNDKAEMYEYNVADNTLLMKPYSLDGYEIDGESPYIGLINDYNITIC